jgi:cytochrome c biogenesis protein ResB
VSAASRPTPGPFELLWRALNSLPVAIFVMLALALLSALGTLIPQQHLNPQPVGMTYAEFLTSRYGAQRYELLHLLGFDRIYFTWYFNALLIWLAVSAVICNIVRWRTTLRLWKTPVVRRGARFFAADKRSWQFAAASDTGTSAQGAVTQSDALAAATPDEAVRAIAADLQQLGYRLRIEQEDTGEGARAVTLYADRGFAKKWALVLLHVALLILLAGGFYGAAVGVKGSIRIAEGETKTLTIDVAAGKYAWVQGWLQRLPKVTYELHEHNFRIDYGRKLLLESQYDNVPAELKEYFWYYVHDYISDLEVTRVFADGRRGKPRRGDVIVNHPLVYDKLVLYQSGYDQRGYLSVTDASGKSRELRLPDPLYSAETWYALTPDEVVVRNPNNMQWVVPIDQGDNYALRPVEQSNVSPLMFQVAQNVKSGDLYRHGEPVGKVSPMAILTLAAAGAPMEMGSLLLTDKTGFETMLGGQPVHVRLSAKTDDYSVFEYKRDPGSPVLFLGWLLLVAGIALTMYVPFTQLWLRAEPGSLAVLAIGPDKRRLRQRLDVMLGVEQRKTS